MPGFVKALWFKLAVTALLVWWLFPRRTVGVVEAGDPTITYNVAPPSTASPLTS